MDIKKYISENLWSIIIWTILGIGAITRLVNPSSGEMIDKIIIFLGSTILILFIAAIIFLFATNNSQLIKFALLLNKHKKVISITLGALVVLVVISIYSVNNKDKKYEECLDACKQSLSVRESRDKCRLQCVNKYK